MCTANFDFILYCYLLLCFTTGDACTFVHVHICAYISAIKFYLLRPNYLFTHTTLFNLSLIACFLTLTFSQSSVATYARSVGNFSNQFTANLPRNLPVKIVNRIRFDKVIAMSLWPHFFGLPCMNVVIGRIDCHLNLKDRVEEQCDTV